MKSMALIAEHARRAFLEYNPRPVDADETGRIFRTVDVGPLLEVFTLDLRSYRGPNSENQQPRWMTRRRSQARRRLPG